MRIVLAAVLAAGLASVAAPASASPSDPIHDLLYGYECVQYPCYVTDYPPYLLDQIGTEVRVNPGYVCVTEPCDQPPLVTACVLWQTYCTP